MVPVQLFSTTEGHFRDDNRAQALTNVKSSGLEVKQKFMLIFTMLYKIQKINLLSALLIPPLMLG